MQERAASDEDPRGIAALMTSVAREEPVRILFIGDIVGRAGRRALLASLPELRRRYRPTFLIANGENAAGGLGITPKIAEELLGAGVDAITLGNHAYHRRAIIPYLDSETRILRPLNYVHSQPGRGYCLLESGGVRLGVINLSGNLFMRAAHPAFSEVVGALAQLEQADHVLVDFHAEATSEKVAMGFHLDGRVTALVGTHTHVQTADARILPGGTAYITDVGMTGARESVIGVERAQALERFLTQMPGHADAAEADPWLMGVLITCAGRRRAAAIEPIQSPAPLQA
jgi:metallophosphoesterase (TIGR00282 family)